MISSCFYLDAWRTWKFYSDYLLDNNEIIEIIASIKIAIKAQQKYWEGKKNWELKLCLQPTILRHVRRHKNTEAYIPLAISDDTIMCCVA